ncbi:MAG: flagellar biosynthesis anti-sigma factor FlgM [Nevskiales bacterium]|nr:flagellar biosynthesis anti-sigma factor FlgM [Nevskiales bacterium]
MSNKIDTYGPQATLPTRQVTPAKADPATAGGAVTSASGGTDSLKLTDDALRMQQVEQAVADAPEINEQRVSEIRQSIEDGSYQVDAQTVAAKLARMEWEFSQS